MPDSEYRGGSYNSGYGSASKKSKSNSSSGRDDRAGGYNGGYGSAAPRSNSNTRGSSSGGNARDERGVSSNSGYGNAATRESSKSGSSIGGIAAGYGSTRGLNPLDNQRDMRALQARNGTWNQQRGRETIASLMDQNQALSTIAGWRNAAKNQFYSAPDSHSLESLAAQNPNSTFNGRTINGGQGVASFNYNNQPFYSRGTYPFRIGKGDRDYPQTVARDGKGDPITANMLDVIADYVGPRLSYGTGGPPSLSPNNAQTVQVATDTGMPSADSLARHVPSGVVQSPMAGQGSAYPLRGFPSSRDALIGPTPEIQKTANWVNRNVRDFVSLGLRPNNDPSVAPAAGNESGYPPGYNPNGPETPGVQTSEASPHPYSGDSPGLLSEPGEFLKKKANGVGGKVEQFLEGLLGPLNPNESGLYGGTNDILAKFARNADRGNNTQNTRADSFLGSLSDSQRAAFGALSSAQQQAVRGLVASGRSFEDALATVKGGAGPASAPFPAAWNTKPRWPNYTKLDWAPTPSGLLG